MSDDKIDFKSRVLCSDGTCIGIIGTDGRCMECGKSQKGGHVWPTLEDEEITKDGEYRCQTCGFIAFGDDPEIVKYEKCLGCGEIMGEGETLKQAPSNDDSLLETCQHCEQQISKRASICPKCNKERTAECSVCKNQISQSSILCPECGDPEPFSEHTFSSATLSGWSRDNVLTQNCEYSPEEHVKEQKPNKKTLSTACLPKKKQIKVLYPSLIASFIAFLIALFTFRDPLLNQPPAKALALALMYAFAVACIVFLAVIVLQAIRRKFTSNVTEPQKHSEPALDGDVSEIGGGQYPWRRYFARFIDLTTLGMLLYQMVIFVAGNLLLQNTELSLSNLILIGTLTSLLWLLVEAGFIAGGATTPGKWLFGISVVSNKGQKLSYSSALKRAFLVWFQGEGFYIPVVALFTQIFAYIRLTNSGTTLWDSSVGSVVTYKKLSVIRVTAVWLVTLMVMVSLLIVLSIE